MGADYRGFKAQRAEAECRMAEVNWLLIIPLVVGAVGIWACSFGSAYVRLIFLLRFPLLTVIAGSVIGLVCLSLPSLLGNLLYVDGPVNGFSGQLLHVTWLSFFLLTFGIAMMRVTARHAHDRFRDAYSTDDRDDLELRRFVDRNLATWQWGWVSWVALFVLALPTPLACVYFTMKHSEPERLTGLLWLEMLFGIFAYLIVRELLVKIVRSSTDRRLTEPLTRWGRFRVRLGAFIHKYGGPGYTDEVEGLSDARVLSAGHQWLAVMFVVVLVCYVVIGVWVHPEGLGDTSAIVLPTLFFGLLVLLLIGLFLGGFSFYVDRYRIPVLPAWIGLGFFAYVIGGIDHRYELGPPIATKSAHASTNSPPDEGTVIRHWLGDATDGDAERARREGLDIDHVKQTWRQTLSATGDDGEAGNRSVEKDESDETKLPVIVVVSAAGGGIQASAWTARVLTGLHARYGDEFGQSIAFISAVSGGSVGAQYYLLARREYAEWLGVSVEDENVLPSPKAVASVNRAARHSGLEAIGWGVLYPDLSRMLFPALYDSTIDRGWALEQSFRGSTQRLAADLGLGSIDPRMKELGEASRLGLPIVAFNATLSETGQRYVMNSVRPTDPDKVKSNFESGQGAAYLWSLYPNSNLRVSTAVRLSATFPFVSPMARPTAQSVPKTHRFYVSDGGYVDSEGFVEVAEWITRVLRKRKQLGMGRFRVLLVRIIPFPDSEDAPSSESGFTVPWRYDTVGPLITMMSVRRTSHPERNDQLEKFLHDNRLFLSPHDVMEARFVFRSVDLNAGEANAEPGKVPLNWKLTPRQQRAIDDAWNAIDSQAKDNPFAEVDRLFDPSQGYSRISAPIP